MTPPHSTEALPQVQQARSASPTSVEWLWQNRLSFGKPSMLDGDPDQGKSLVNLDLIARLTTGRPMPDGAPGPGVIPCLILQSEDNFDDTVVPRLKALGADLDKVYFWRDELGDQPLRLPVRCDLLERAVRQTGARYVSIDPLVSFLDRSVMLCSDHQVRLAMQPLVQLAESLHFCPLLVRHLNKQGKRAALYRGGGSIGLAAFCRSVWVIGRDPHDPGRRVLAQEKNNLGRQQPSLAYEIVAAGGEAPTIVWCGESPWSANELVEARELAPALARACAVIRDCLKDGPRCYQEIHFAAKKAGIAERTFRRARKTMEVQFKRVHRNNLQQTFWFLPGQLPPQYNPDIPLDFALALGQDEEVWLKAAAGAAPAEPTSDAAALPGVEEPPAAPVPPPAAVSPLPTAEEPRSASPLPSGGEGPGVRGQPSVDAAPHAAGEPPSASPLPSGTEGPGVRGQPSVDAAPHAAGEPPSASPLPSGGEGPGVRGAVRVPLSRLHEWVSGVSAQPAENLAAPTRPAAELPEVTAEPGTLLYHVQCARRMLAIHAAPHAPPE